MKLVATRKAEQNEAAIDPWTAVHFSSGLATGLMGVGFWPTLLGALAYDGLEQLAERHPMGQRLFRTSKPESAANVVVDTLVFLGGWYLGRRYNDR